MPYLEVWIQQKNDENCFALRSDFVNFRSIKLWYEWNSTVHIVVISMHSNFNKFTSITSIKIKFLILRDINSYFISSLLFNFHIHTWCKSSLCFHTTYGIFQVDQDLNLQQFSAELVHLLLESCWRISQNKSILSKQLPIFVTNSVYFNLGLI